MGQPPAALIRGKENMKLANDCYRIVIRDNNVPTVAHMQTILDAIDQAHASVPGLAQRDGASQGVGTSV